MKLMSSIFFKLILFITPLVCLPIAAVGYLATEASVDRVNRLVRQEQMLQLEATAKKINDVFFSCRLDLETLSNLPTLEDFHLARSFRLKAEEDFNRDNLVRIFSKFIARTTYYQSIIFLNAAGLEEIKVTCDGPAKEHFRRNTEDFFRQTSAMNSDGLFYSGILDRPSGNIFFLEMAKPFFTGWREMAGVVLIEVDFDKILEIVKSIKIGRKGYAFLVDQLGQCIAHPHFEPYELKFSDYPDRGLNELALEMETGLTGWKSYNFQGETKVAAFAPVPSMGWSLAVTIPLEEFRKEALAIQTKVIEVVVVALILTVAGLALLSYHLLRPVRRLVNATNRIAGGDLNQEIRVQSSDELGELTESFNRMVVNLSQIQNELVRSEKLISLGRLSAGVAHEIRNPLNAIKGAIVHLKRRRPDDALIIEYTQLVLEEIDRLSNFVTEFLMFSRQTPPKRIPTDLNKLILHTQKVFDMQAQEKEVLFFNRLDTNIPLLDLDPQQMEQILVNLILNALEAVSAGGAITISSSLVTSGTTRNSPSLVRVTVHDNGPGIPDKNLQNIFDPFFSTKETGTGLGLPLSLGIAELHGGTLKASSNVGQGTRFFLELPVELDRPGGDKIEQA
ncbi:MAG: HAMP domain-containing protein [Deltaproteobacteria bacterium]|nr:HAMP domain-containing protein [Deltaproteobacteria bacterium]